MNSRELKQQRRRRLWKQHYNSEFSLLQTLSPFFHLAQFAKCWHIFLELNKNSKTVRKFWKRKRKLLSCVPVLNKTWNDAISRRSHAVTENVQKSAWKNAHEKLLFCWSKPIALLTFSLPSLSLLLPISKPQMWIIMVLQVKLYHAPGQQTVQVWPALFLKHCLKHFLMLTKERLQVVKHFLANPPARLTSVLKVSMSTFGFIVLNVIY